MSRIKISSDGKKLHITVPLKLLAFAAEHGPFLNHVDPESVAKGDEFRVTNRRKFAQSVVERLRAEQGEDGTTLVHEMLDDAIEQVVDNGEPGFAWPAAGID